MQMIMLLINSVYVMDHSHPNEDSGHIAGTSQNDTFIRPSVIKVYGHPKRLITGSDESQKHAQHDCESTGTSNSRKRKRVSGQSHEDRSCRLEKLQDIIFKVLNKRKDFTQEYDQTTRDKQGDLELSRYFDNLKGMLVKFAHDTYIIKGMIINTGIDNDDSLSLISKCITFGTNEKKKKGNFKSSFFELNIAQLDVRCEDVKKFSQLLVDHVGYNNEGYYILTTDEKISETKKFGSESVKCIGCRYHHRNSCSCIQKIVSDLFVNSLQMLFRTKVVDKCLLFPEFTSLCGYFTQFTIIKTKNFVIK